MDIKGSITPWHKFIHVLRFWNMKGEKQNGLHMETGKREEQHELKED
jgi:hypothetical protein